VPVILIGASETSKAGFQEKPRDAWWVVVCASGCLGTLDVFFCLLSGAHLEVDTYLTYLPTQGAKGGPGRVVAGLGYHPSIDPFIRQSCPPGERHTSTLHPAEAASSRFEQKRRGGATPTEIKWVGTYCR
jgi:hypothetical protein